MKTFLINGLICLSMLPHVIYAMELPEALFNNENREFSKAEADAIDRAYERIKALEAIQRENRGAVQEAAEKIQKLEQEQKEFIQECEARLQALEKRSPN